MPQLDFSEALSTPNEKLFSSPATATASAAPLDKKANVLARGVQFSRSTWANIFFVTIASVGGLACAFYFFNGGELLRAAAAWPNEFLYPRPLSTDKIDIAQQPNPVDRFANNEAGSTKSDETKAPLGKNLGPPDFSQPATAIGASNPTVTTPVEPGATLLPATPGLPVAPPLPNGLDVPSAPSTDSLFQSLYQTATSVAPKKTAARTPSITRSSPRRKAVRAQQKVAGQTKNMTSVTRSTIQSQSMQQTSNQIQAPMSAIQAPNQMTMGGGLGGGIGGAAVGGVGGGLGGGLGGIGGGLGGGLGGLPGHH
jgi:hypothetical protein